jgi:hypothetical protein
MVRHNALELIPVKIDTEACHYCGGHNIVRGRQRIASGMTYAVEWCRDCDKRASGPQRPFLPKRPGDELLPILIDYLNPEDRCEVCGKAGTELHHWAPTVVFHEEADGWPKGHLCHDCHEYWAKKIKAYFVSKMRRTTL